MYTIYMSNGEGGIDMPQQVDSGEGGTDILHQTEILWQDPQTVSFSLRRHAEKRAAEPRGGLSTEGIPATQSAAAEWVHHLPAHAHVTLVESPSPMPGATIQRGGRDYTPMPARAQMTGSIYRRALVDASSSQGGDGSGDSAVVLEDRQQEKLLGDYFETCNRPPGEYFKALSASYGRTTPQFWTDFFEGHLSQSVQEASDACGLSSAQDLSRNMAAFIATTTDDITSGAPQTEPRKHVILGITHEENLGGFMHSLARYVESSGNLLFAEKVGDRRFGYNDGIDIHIPASKDGPQVASIVVDGSVISIPLEELRKL